MNDQIRPIYTSEKLDWAYQLNWDLTLFWREAQEDDSWLATLREQTETKDGIRILKHRFQDETISHILVSTRPDRRPDMIPQRVKGRLQHLVRDERPQAFQRNYALRSVGSSTRDKLEEYIAGQTEHHPMADSRVQKRMETYSIHNPEIDLSQPRKTSHGLYWYNLHVVMANDGAYHEIVDERLSTLRDMAQAASRKHGHRISRGSVVTDHVHLLMGCDITESPAEVALSYMNNFAYACGRERLFMWSCFVGTCGEYDLGVTL